MFYYVVRIATSDPAQPFRGFAIQARQSTENFTNDASFLGQFVNAPDDGDWRIWDCATVSQHSIQCMMYASTRLLF